MKKTPIIVTGTICEARRTAKSFKGKKSEECFYLSLKNVEYSNPSDKDTIKNAFADCGKKFTPNWVENIDDGFVNTKTKFDLPIRYDGVDYTSMEDLMSDSDEFYPIGAKCKLSLAVKSGAIYPKALVILENGEPIDAFADFE